MALAERRSFLFKSLSSSEVDEDLKRVFERFKQVCDSSYVDMIQI